MLWWDLWEESYPPETEMHVGLILEVIIWYRYLQWQGNWLVDPFQIWKLWCFYWWWVLNLLLALETVAFLLLCCSYRIVSIMNFLAVHLSVFLRAIGVIFLLELMKLSLSWEIQEQTGHSNRPYCLIHQRNNIIHNYSFYAFSGYRRRLVLSVYLLDSFFR